MDDYVKTESASSDLHWTNRSKTAEQVDRHLLQRNPNDTQAIEPANDAGLAYSAQNNQFSSLGSFRMGRVQMMLPHANSYRVAIENGGGEMSCVMIGTGSSYNTLGTRDASVIPPDTSVLVYCHPGCRQGYIMGAVPLLNEDGNHTYSDWISQGSNVGMLRQRYYTEYLRLLSDEGGLKNFSSGRPLDSLAFDWTHVAETGLKFHMDPYMVCMSVDEECGVTGFYHDRLLRVAGYNLDLWTGVRLEEDRVDEGELYTFKGECTYPYEMQGSYVADVDCSRETDDAKTLHEDPYAKVEPQYDDLQPFTRYQEYGGYLGQGKQRIVTLPPDSKVNGTEPRRYEDTDADLGVFREHIAMHGGYSLESAKHVYIVKRGLIPVPKRIRPSDDYSEKCDSAENGNYKFSGEFGDGKEHKVGDLDITADNRGLYSAAAVLDLHTYAFNWEAVHAFHYHEKDFKLPEESGLKLERAQYLPPFGELTTKMWLPTPDAKEMTVDHRYGNVKFWELMQHISLTEDGALVIQAGQGEEIRLSNGGIQISTAGKIMIQSGGTTAILAGDDLIAKAYNSVDVTATNKDVRVKAEVNTMLLAGNSGEGVMLLENRATGKEQNYPNEGGESIRGSGVILKAKSSQVAALAGDVYLRSGVGGSGTLTLDGNRGSSDIRLIGRNLLRYVSGKMKDSFGIQSPSLVNDYTGSGVLFGGFLRVNSSIIASGSGVFGSSVAVVNGSVSSPAGGQLGRLLDREGLQAQISRIAEAVDDSKKATEDDIQKMEDELYGENKIGNSDVADRISFGLRTDKEYGTEDFSLPQNAWQILNEVVGAGVSWVEKDVLYQSSTRQQPWPGKAAWSENETFLTVPKEQFKLFDLEQGRSKDRTDEAFETRELGDFVKKVPSQAYKILPSSNE